MSKQAAHPEGFARVLVDRATAMRFDRYVMLVGTRVAKKRLGCGDIVLANVTTGGLVQKDTLERLTAKLDECEREVAA